MNLDRISRRFGVLGVAALLLAATLDQLEAGKDDVVKMTAAQFAKEFRKSQKKTIAKYKGKQLEFTGKVLRVMRDFSGKPSVEMEIGNEFGGVSCFTVDPQPWGTFARGQTVKVTGKMPEFPVVPKLIECTVEAVTKSPLQTITAAALAKECADALAANKKFDKGTLKVTGVVVSSVFNEKTNFTDLILKGAGKTQVACRLVPPEKDAGAALKAGKSVTLVGAYGATYDNAVHIDNAMVLTEKK